MEIVTRKRAIEAHLNSYYTGQPCKYGHVTERYTTSGACKGCLSDATRATRAAITPGPNARSSPERLAQLEQLTPLKLRAYPKDAAALLDTVQAVTLARSPLLVATDVVGLRKGTKPAGGTLLYLANVDPADVGVLRDIQNALLNAGMEPIEEVRRRVFGGFAAQAEEARDNGEGEWKFT